MRRTENDCCNCGLPCTPLCSRGRSYAVLICDKCKDEPDRLFKVGCRELCERCAIEENMEDFVKDMAEEWGYDWLSDRFDVINEEDCE